VTASEFIDMALAVPFKDKGRDYAGWDCYGLAYCFYRDVLGINLPLYLDYESTRDYEALHRVITERQADWVEVDMPEFGDIALFTLGTRRTHLGVVLNRFHMVHAEGKVGTIVEPFNSSLWKKRREGFYRHERHN